MTDISTVTKKAQFLSVIELSRTLAILSWNGWDRPYFTKEIALEICKEFSSEEFRCYYDENTDTFFSEDDDSVPNKEEIGTPTEINTPEGKIKVYDFGCAGWIWEEKQKIKEN